jgi:amidase
MTLFSLPSCAALVAVMSCATGCIHDPKLPRNIARDRGFISYWPRADNGTGLRLAVKDLIDIKGHVTTAGSEYLAKNSPPAAQDARCLALVRQRNVHIIGKTNLTEFAAGVSGRNDYFGAPRNRVHGKEKIIPGGSSSGSAVVVENGSADVSFGSDTAGSIRVPAACCGVYGLKTTYGLVSLKGVFPLSPKHLDTVGPLAKDIPHLVQGMDLLQAGFATKYARAVAAKPSARQIRVGRLYLDGTDPAIDKAIDAALAANHFRVIKLDKNFKKKWEQAQADGKTIAVADIWRSDSKYYHKKGVSGLTNTVMSVGALTSTHSYDAAVKRKAAWQRTLRELFKHVDVIAVPTLQHLPPKIPFFGISALFESQVFNMQNTVGVNYAGNPALAVPVRMPLPPKTKIAPVTSVQFIGHRLGEAELINAGRLLKATP